MAKSVYSVVLDDAVVAAVDSLAARQGASRSAMIDRILAQHVQLDTPRQQIQDVLESLGQMVGGGALQLLSASEAQMQLRSPLRYKYNPTVRYQIELFRRQSGPLGELRVTLRTQNAGLLQDLADFYRLWAALESAHLPHPETLEYAAGGGRFARMLRAAPPGCTPEELGETLAGYVGLFDDCLKLFFALPSPAEAAVQVEKTYRSRLSRAMQSL